MSIAIICPIGPLDRWGYQHVYSPCVASMAAFADTIYMPQTTRNRAGVDELIMDYDNIVHVGNESTWFAEIDGNEHFDLFRLRDNINRAIERAREDGHQIALCVEVNQYIPVAAREPLAALCAEVRANDQPYGWLFRRDQLAGATFHASLRRPWIWNLAFDVRIEIPDGTLYDNQFIRHERGNWPLEDAAAIVDAANEMSAEDLRDKLTAFRFYSEFVRKRPTTFDWNYQLSYYVAKFRAKELDYAELDIYGQAIADVAAGHPEFMSHEILRAI
jgi:hypothetical protein